MTPPRPARERRTNRVLLGLATVLVLAGAAATWGPDDAADDAPPAATPTATGAPATPWAEPTGAPSGLPGPADPDARGVAAETVSTAPPPSPRPGRPERLRIPSLGVDAPIVPIVDSRRSLVPPADPQVLGWWSPGARPGAVRGSALVTGHTVSSGGGALDDLSDVELGARIEVRTQGQRMPYVVRKVRVFGKGRLLTEADRLFDQEVQGRLVVITCADWNGREYLSNVVVTAVPHHTKVWLTRHPGREARLSPSVFPLPTRR
ncbi:MAG: class sortase [Nocardioides sp.]|nr:class sortase [Nocardioides sp.]